MWEWTVLNDELAELVCLLNEEQHRAVLVRLLEVMFPDSRGFVLVLNNPLTIQTPELSHEAVVLATVAEEGAKKMLNAALNAMNADGAGEEDSKPKLVRLDS